MKVVLLGYMASGKSTIGKQLAKMLSITFVDLDEYIEKEEQKKVSDIFDEKGEIYFRLQEHKYLKELLVSKDNFVLSLGGGTPCYAGNMELLTSAKNIASVYLHTNIATVVERLKTKKGSRPLVAKLSYEELTEFVAKHIFERSNFYEQATHKLLTKEKSVTEIVREIRTLLV